LVELTDAELDAVTGGLNVLGAEAQSLGGAVLGGDLNRITGVSRDLTGNAKLATELAIVPAAQTTV